MNPPTPAKINEAHIAISGLVDAASFLSESAGLDFAATAAALASGDSGDRPVLQRLNYQAKTLDAMFYKLLRRAEKLDPESALPYYDLALKFQGASMRTLSAIANIQKPRPQPAAIVQNFVREQLNQLLVLGDTQNAQMDSRISEIAGREDQTVATLAEVNRSANPTGQDQLCIELTQ
jgi:hypothetical protein